MKLLLDTNIAIALEDPTPVNPIDAAFAEGCEKHGLARFVAKPNYKDVQRDRNRERRERTLSKLNKYPKLGDVSLPSREDLEARFGEIKSPNDECDVELLGILDADVVDFLISEDAGLHRRAERAGIGSRVFDIADALVWLRQSYEPLSVQLPYVEDVAAYELDLNDVFFDSLRLDYAEFDSWFKQKCVADHRPCWVVRIDSQLAGLVIRKEEPPEEADCEIKSGKILKVSTFKMAPEYQGEKFGEQLLKQVLWWAQTNGFATVYLTAYKKQESLIYLLTQYGFRISKTLASGELVVERQLYQGELPTRAPDDDAAQYARHVYPRYRAGSDCRKFVIPIRPEYHKVLFPEIADYVAPEQEQIDMFGFNTDDDRTPGNTIRKVYLCRSNTKQMRPGDVVYFYATKEPLYARSQSITSIGVVEATHQATSVDELVYLTAKRSVYTLQQMRAMLPTDDSPVLVIDFLLVSHLQQPVPLTTLCGRNVFASHPPQSITKLSEKRHDELQEILGNSATECL